MLLNTLQRCHSGVVFKMFDMIGAACAIAQRAHNAHKALLATL